jgi:hypothetical protein
MAGKKHLQNDARARLVANYLKLKKASLIVGAGRDPSTEKDFWNI